MAADMGTLQRLPKIVGNDSLVREYAFSCAKIDPEEAKTVRLVFFYLIQRRHFCHLVLPSVLLPSTTSMLIIIKISTISS